MKLYTIITLLLLSVVLPSCGKIENSNSLDDIKYTNFTETGSPNYLIAKAAINSACLQCHGIWKQYTEQTFIDTGLVVRGDPDASKLYYRNQQVSTGPGPKNMPPSGNPAISSADLAAMQQWISAL